MRRLALAPVAAVEAWLAAVTAYQLALLGLAATRRAPAADPPPGVPLRTVVIVCAHNEEAVLAPTLRSLNEQDFPAEVIVIADNCDDATADIGRAAGVTVWERVHDDRGKGQALAWALERLWRDRLDTEAVAIVDADCFPGPGLLAALDGALRAGADAAQAIYDVANPDASPTAALRWAAYALKHRVRPRGRAALGLSAGLYGSGMAFRASLLRAQPWRGFSVAEDIEYHLQLAQAGVRVAFAGDVSVETAMPTTPAAAHTQQLRWESGNARLVRVYALPLAREGLRRRDLNLVVAAFDLVVAAQALLVPAGLACLGVSALARSRPLTTTAAACVAGNGLYVLAGLRVAEAPPAVYRALGAAPKLVARKLALFGAIARGRGTAEYLRTTREPAPPEPVEVS